MAELDAAETELIDAKAAYRADPTEKNLARKEAATAEIERVRAVERAGRTGLEIGGDAYIEEPQPTDGTED